MKKHCRNKRGFTLIELLVVIAIIIILVGILLAALQAVWKKSDQAQTQGVIDTLVIGIEKYYEVNGRYPYPDNNDAEIPTPPYVKVTDSTKQYRTQNLYKALMTTVEGGPFCTVSDTFVEKDGTEKYFIDKWDEPLRYIPAANYSDLVSTDTTSPPDGVADTGVGGAVKNEESVFYNFTTYQIRSMGDKDGEDNLGRKNDVQNFTMKR